MSNESLAHSAQEELVEENNETLNPKLFDEAVSTIYELATRAVGTHAFDDLYDEMYERYQLALVNREEPTRNALKQWVEKMAEAVVGVPNSFNRRVYEGWSDTKQNKPPVVAEIDSIIERLGGSV